MVFVAFWPLGKVGLRRSEGWCEAPPRGGGTALPNLSLGRCSNPALSLPPHKRAAIALHSRSAH